MRLRTKRHVERLPRKKRVRYRMVASTASKDARQAAVEVGRRQKSCKMRRRRIDVEHTCQLIDESRIRHTRTAQHPRRAVQIFADVVHHLAEHRSAMVGIQLYDVLILCIILFDVGEQLAKAAVGTPHAFEDSFQMESRIHAVYARRIVVRIVEPIGKPQRDLRLKGHLPPGRRARMRILYVEEDKLIALGKGAHLCQRIVDTVIRMKPIAAGLGNQPVVAARHAVVDTARISPNVHAIVAKTLHLFRKRQDGRSQFSHTGGVEDLRMMWIEPRIDRRQSRIRILCN